MILQPHTWEGVDMKIKSFIGAILIAFALESIPTVADAHGGRTAADGCHKNSKTGTRHCHGKKSTAKKYQPKASYQNGSIYYPNCDAARRAGKSNIRRGQAGYGKHLDRDGDGVACE